MVRWHNTMVFKRAQCKGRIKKNTSIIGRESCSALWKIKRIFYIYTNWELQKGTEPMNRPSQETRFPAANSFKCIHAYFFFACFYCCRIKEYLRFDCLTLHTLLVKVRWQRQWQFLTFWHFIFEMLIFMDTAHFFYT